MIARTLRRGLVVASAVLLAASCSSDVPRHSERLYAFATFIELTAYGLDETAFAEAAEQTGQRLEDWHRQWHPWEGDGLAAINRRLAEGQATAIEPDLAGLIDRARELEAASEGHFNGGLGALTRLWGFHAGTDLPDAPPPDEAIKALTDQPPSLAAVRLDEGRIHSTDPRVRIDLGGFAKGVAAERITALLRRRGAAATVVSLGGDIATHGHPPGRDWRIGIRAPRGEGLLATARLEAGEAIFTSGDYERHFTHNGRRYHHLLDPRTGSARAGCVR
ncbi:MAG: FAD:protein FMN transferase [Arhodomonas sp.]|nr:FAD:protein FMN transferase [Arhodomonas sp.]